MEDETLPSNFDYIEPEEETEAQDFEDENNLKVIHSLSNSKGWKIIKEHIENQIDWNIQSSKGLNTEDMATYGAKRLAADAVEVQLKGILNFVEIQAKEYKEKVKK
jgi:hypothetical protein